MKTFIEHLQERAGLAAGLLSVGMLTGEPQTAPVSAPVTAPVTAPTTQTDQTTTTTKPAAAVEDPYAHFGGAHNVKLYQALVAAEHRGTDIGNALDYNAGQYIRTKDKSGTSTAYGPVQITKSTAAGFLKNQPDLFKGQEDYVNQYVKQGKSMLGNVKIGDACGPGGCGTLSDEKYHIPYQQMAVGVMRGKQRELKIDDTKEMSPKDRERFIQYWRNASREQDPAYYKAIDDAYKAN